MALYSENPFRLLNLPTTAPAGEFRRAAAMLQKSLAIGRAPQTSSLVPFLADCNLDGPAVAGALRELEDPCHRLRREIYWPNADYAEVKGRAAMLRSGRFDEFALTCASAAAGRDGGLGTQYLAIARHAAAITVATNGGDSALGRFGQWRFAYEAWRRLQCEDAFWRYLEGRVAVIADPRLDLGYVDRLRAGLLGEVLAPGMALAASAAARGDWPTHAGQLYAISESNCQAGLSADIANELLRPLCERLESARALLGDAIAGSTVAAEQANQWADPLDCLEMCRGRLTRLHSHLSKCFTEDAAQLAPWVERAPEAAKTLDAAARTLRQLSLALNNKAELPRLAFEVNRVASKIAVGPETKATLKEDRATLLNILRRIGEPQEPGPAPSAAVGGRDSRPLNRAPMLRTINGFGTMLLGKRKVDAATGSYVATLFIVLLFVPVFPLGSYRVTRGGKGYRFYSHEPTPRPLVAWRWAMGALAVVAMVAMMAQDPGPAASVPTSLGVGNSSPSAAMAQPAAAAQLVSPPPSGYVVDTPAAVQPESAKQRLGNWIDQEKPQLVAAQSKLDDDQADVERNRSNLALLSPDSSDQASVDTYNAAVDDFNRELDSWKADSRALQARIDHFNAEVARYNAMPEDQR